MRAIFLDKDGTLLEDVPYNVEPRRMRLTPRAGEALQLLAPHYGLIVISNQSGVAHGYFPESALAAVERRLRDLLAVYQVELAGFYYCPHHPQGQVAAYRADCECRKPRPGMITRAAADHTIDLAQSWMVGDILDDIEAGRAAGCRAVLIDNGGETEWQMPPQRRPDFTAGDLYVAAERILAERERGYRAETAHRSSDALASRNRLEPAQTGGCSRRLFESESVPTRPGGQG